MGTTSLLDAFSQTLRDFNYYPVTSWSRLFNFTPSLFTFNVGDEDVEQDVIDHVGSYGSQLSTILKMLDVLNKHVLPKGLDEIDKATLNEFKVLIRDSREVVAKHKGELGIRDEKRVAAYLRKAAKKEFGEKVFNELKEIFEDSSGRN